MSTYGTAVGVDGSPASDAALVYAFDDAAARGGSVLVVTAWWVGPVLPEDRDHEMDQHRSAASLTQDRAIVRASAEVDGVPTIARRLVHGEPAAALLQAAEDCDQLVVGSVHKGLWRRVTEGSVSAQCVRNSPVPVTVVPWPARAAGQDTARAHGGTRLMAQIIA